MSITPDNATPLVAWASRPCRFGKTRATRPCYDQHMVVEDLGTMRYRDAWAVQQRVHEKVLAGGEEHLLLVEHPPVITLGRRPGLAKNILAARDVLEKLGVDVVESDRGGDVTFHGPGQLVAYPIVRLADHKLSVGGY